jgi:hypothetical protein
MPNNVYKTWEEIKGFLGSGSLKDLELQYHEHEYKYYIFVVEAGVEYFTEIWKDTSQVKGIDVTQNNLDKTDFETYYKVDANQAIDENVTVENEIDVIAQVANIATEDTLLQVSGALEGLGTGLATEATLQALLDTFGEETGTNLLIKIDELQTKIQTILEAIGQGSGTDILTELQNLEITVDTGDLATEATLIQVRDYIDTLETKLQSIIDKLDVNLSTRASESTSQEIKETIGQESGATVLSRLKDIWDKLVELFNTGVAKVKIWDGTNVAEVVEQSGDVKRLAVDVQTPLEVTATVTNDESPTKYQLKTDYDVDGITLNTTTDVVLFSATGQGVIDLIAVNCLTSSSWEVVIEIDGTERIRIPMPVLGSTLGLTNSDYDIAVETANKQFRYHPAQVGFKTGFRVLAKAIVATPEVHYLVMYREKIED